MQYLTVNEIRKLFLEYFESKGHKIKKSAPLVNNEDSTLLFVNAGMVPFKDYFTGKKKPQAKKQCSIQKCLRAGGKHNDFENVGYTTRHHTFFEMLGNFSFGAYFKKEAIEMAYEFIINHLKLPKDKLIITVYKSDNEAYKIWQEVGIEKDKIIKIDTSDNFWAMGDTGPCGPCSEIFFDRGEAFEGGLPGSIDEGERYLEIWNLVFMQYNREENQELKELPNKNIDTGIGLERIASILQEVESNYEIDIFKEIIEHNEKLLGINQTSNNKASFQIIADHIRSSTFLIADGVLPSNEGRGYILRKIIRRAIRHINLLGYKSAIFYKSVELIVRQNEEIYPELKQAKEVIEEVIRGEEESFIKLLKEGLKKIELKLKSLKGSQMSGYDAFELYETYGIPIELIKEILKQKSITVNEKEYEEAR